MQKNWERQLFVSDFDRTLYVNGKISSRNLSAIRKWREKGNLFVVASGRDMEGLDHILKDQQVEPDYLICNNGGCIMDSHGKVLYLKTLDYKCAQKVVGFIRGFCEGEISASYLHGKAVLQEQIPMEKELLQLHKRFETEPMARKLGRALEQEFDEYPIQVFCNVHNVDIVSAGVNKAEAVAYLVTYCELQTAPMVIGDSYNDLDMIRIYKGYTMKTASEMIRSVAAGVYVDVAACMNQ